MKRRYGFTVDTDLTFEAAESRVRELLKEEGFGVLTEIDIKQTLKDKLDVDFRPYRILGACNPALSHRALQVEPGIGLLLPCNVVVEGGPAGGSRISFLDPEIALGLVGNPELEPIAKDASQRLRRVADRLSGAASFADIASSN
ncbi:MAG TPA: DUF302 domain-containing protein [Candidatus Micrarchaeaceae archaeon]|nr:DUF302 domain-containing protein [Candidatus Micrarchaeaceae archaeon]